MKIEVPSKYRDFIICVVFKKTRGSMKPQSERASVEQKMSSKKYAEYLEVGKRFSKQRNENELRKNIDPPAWRAILRKNHSDDEGSQNGRNVVLQMHAEDITDRSLEH